MPRTTRALPAALGKVGKVGRVGTVGLVAVTALLTACERPAPRVTVLSGSTTTVVRPQSFCFDGDPNHCRTASKTVTTITAKAGASLLIDVPREVAKKDWAATSASQQSDGTLKELSGNGLASGPQHDRHSTRLQVPYGVASYYVVVLQLRGEAQTGSWVARVDVTS